MGYRYYGLVLGKAKATLALVHVAVLLGGAHTAVWLGASNRSATTWVQAGIAMDSYSVQPFVYIETRHNGRRTLRTWPASWGHRSVVRLRHHGDCWRVLVGGHRSQWVRVPRAAKIAALETYGTMWGLNEALIDGHPVRGR